MGRKKLEIKRIEKNSSRQVTFCKRRNGLIEKARQLSVLCEASVGLLVVSASDKLYSFSSGDSKLVESIDDVSVDSLVELEDHLETALSVTRARKAELMLKLVESLKEKENLLKEENQVLASQVGLGKIGRFKYLAIAFLASSARLIINWKS
ncbi:hypothetical protein YC2023_027914 [Brassica napus]